MKKIKDLYYKNKKYTLSDVRGKIISESIIFNNIVTYNYSKPLFNHNIKLSESTIHKVHDSMYHLAGQTEIERYFYFINKKKNLISM